MVPFKFQYGATNISVSDMVLNDKTKFKFQYGATNIQIHIFVLYLLQYLNSNMELLIYYSTYFYQSRFYQFKFQYGATNICSSNPVILPSSLFKFQYGATNI